MLAFPLNVTVFQQMKCILTFGLPDRFYRQIRDGNFWVLGLIPPKEGRLYTLRIPKVLRDGVPDG
jgi:hypothetical protein